MESPGNINGTEFSDGETSLPFNPFLRGKHTFNILREGPWTRARAPNGTLGFVHLFELYYPNGRECWELKENGSLKPPSSNLAYKW